MKKMLFVSVILFLLIHSANAQKIDTSFNKYRYPLYESYVYKSRTNIITGWIFLGAGLAMATGGTIWHSSGFLDYDNQNRGLWLFYLGCTTAVSSTPFFVAGRKYKKMARLFLKNEKIMMADHVFVKQNYTAIALAIPF